MVFGVDKKALTEKKLVNLIFSTKQRGKKENIFAAEVGSILFEFRVDEMDVKVSVNGAGVGKVGGENDSDPCVVFDRQSEPENAAVNDGLDKAKSVKAVISGKVFNDVLGGSLNLGSGHVGERELMCCGSHVPKSNKLNRPVEESVSPGCVLDKSKSLGHGSVEDRLSLVEGNESVWWKVSRANPRTNGDRSMIFEVFEEVYSVCFLWRSLTLNVVKDQS
ncbi:hypothetical protein V6N13_106072 [Hibiscus sabdariffa]